MNPRPYGCPEEAGVLAHRSFGHRGTKHADVSLLIGAPERLRSLHIRGHVRVPSRCVIVALEVYSVESSALHHALPPALKLDWKMYTLKSLATFSLILFTSIVTARISVQVQVNSGQDVLELVPQ